MFPFFCCDCCASKKNVRIEFVSDELYYTLSLSALALSEKIKTRDQFLNYIHSHGSEWYCENLYSGWTIIHPDYLNSVGVSTCVNNSVIGQFGDLVYSNQFLYMRDYYYDDLTQQYVGNFYYYTYNIYYFYG